MPNKPDDTNQPPVIPPGSSDSVESQVAGVVQKKQEEIIALLEEKINSLLIANNLLKSEIEILAYRAGHDTLTKLTNRFNLSIWIKEYIQQNTEFCILCIDLNKFKPINDTYGHPIGDLALCLVADVFREIMSKYESSIISRTGGDEFVGVFSARNISDAIIIANDMRNILASKFNKPSKIPFFTFSIGIAGKQHIGEYNKYIKDNNLDPISETDCNLVWNLGDAALNGAKKEKNNILVWSTDCIKTQIEDSEVKSLSEKLNSALRSVNDKESAKFLCEVLGPEIFKNFLLNTNK